MPSNKSIYRKRVVAEVDAVPEEYLPLLLQMVRTYRESVDLKPAAKSFQKAWQEAQAGETMPVKHLGREYMATEPLPFAYTPEFMRNLRQLAKKYRPIREDLEPVIAQMATGGTPGDQIAGVTHEVYKARAANSDARKGKSGGYRIIYQVKPAEAIVLITVYSKSDQTDVSAAEIRSIIVLPGAGPEPLRAKRRQPVLLRRRRDLEFAAQVARIS